MAIVLWDLWNRQRQIPRCSVRETLPEAVKVEEQLLRFFPRPVPWSRLGWVAVAVLLLLGFAVAAFVGLGSRDKEQPVAAANEKIMLAVMPLEVLGDEPDQDYFGEGLTEEMITQLGRLSPDQLGVIARTSAARAKASDKPLEEIARQLGVDYILEGAVRREEDDVRVTARLIQVSDLTLLWADGYERRAGIFEIQSEVAQRIAESLALELLPETRQSLDVVPTASGEAHEAYLRGRFFWGKRTEAGLRQGLEHFKRAAELDPEYALAHVGIADTYNMLANYSLLAPVEALPRAIEAADRALELSPNLAEAMTARTWASWTWYLDLPEAERGFVRSLERNSNYEFTHQLYRAVPENGWSSRRGTRHGQASASARPSLAHPQRGRGLAVLPRSRSRACDHRVPQHHRDGSVVRQGPCLLGLVTSRARPRCRSSGSHGAG